MASGDSKLLVAMFGESKVIYEFPIVQGIGVP